MRASETFRRAGGRRWAALAAALAAMLTVAAPAGAATYRVVDLGTLGGASSAANDLNNAGAVVGWALTASGKMHAVVWRNGHKTDIGTLGGPTSMATGISNNFAVVGTASVAAGGVQHGFLWRANQGAMHNLGIPLPVRIGDTGAIIGNATTAAGESVAAYRSQHGWVRLPLRGFDGSHGEDVNDAGTAVGTLFDDPHGSAPFVYANGVLTVLPSVPTASETSADAINDAGLIAGQTFDPLGIVLWDGVSWQPVATPALVEPRDPRHERLRPDRRGAPSRGVLQAARVPHRGRGGRRPELADPGRNRLAARHGHRDQRRGRDRRRRAPQRPAARLPAGADGLRGGLSLGGPGRQGQSLLASMEGIPAAGRLLTDALAPGSGGALPR